MLGVSSCTSPPPAKPAGPPAQSQGYWRGDGVPGSPKLVISLSEQCVRYYKGGELVGESPISSGREGHSTRPGSYRIMQKDLVHRSTLYGAFVDASGNIVQEDVDVRKDRAPPGARFVGADMPGFMRITGAVGMHAGYLPGYPASHGCIRLPAHMANIFYHETPHGTPVQIVGSAANAPARAPPAASAVAKPEVKKKSKAQGHWVGSNRKPRTPAGPRGQTLYLVE